MRRPSEIPATWLDVVVCALALVAGALLVTAAG
jgi:hypothetical protein